MQFSEPSVGHVVKGVTRPTGGHVVIAPDKFKGSLTAGQAAAAMARGVARADPTLRTVQCPVADGGDGTLETVIAAGFERVPVYAIGPTGQLLLTAYARKGDTAVIEMAEICGLQRLPGAVPAPMAATSHGLGAVVAQALDQGCRDVVIGVGGSASTDGGAGFLTALGAVALDDRGARLGPGGQAIGTCAHLDLTGLRPEIGDASFTIAADVDNPLYGPFGAANVYGPQKGASPEQVTQLDGALRSWADVVDRATHTDAREAPGAGAAGGIGFAALAVLGAHLRPGIDLIIDLIGLDEHLAGARAAITGEGSLDQQSLRGKAAVGVSRRAGAFEVPTYAVAGVSSLSAAEARGAGLAGVHTLTDVEPDRRRCVEQAADLLVVATERMVRASLGAVAPG
ncbi:MAG: glycerate kinase [Mycobacterium sp.]|jgi:glycerate kinase|nr:glycerate kinase [Mycobacterium sp.]MDT5180144.1 glycerate 2-kinase [Mycobacterium sp.]